MAIETVELGMLREQVRGPDGNGRAKAAEPVSRAKVAVVPRTIRECMIDLMRAVGKIDKAGWNEGQKFHYRGIDQVQIALQPALIDCGIVLSFNVLERQAEVRQGRKANGQETLQNAVALKIRFTFRGPAGDRLVYTVWGEGMDAGDKATAKAMSSAFKQVILLGLCIPTALDSADPDKDGDEATSAGVGAPAVEPVAVQTQARARSAFRSQRPVAAERTGGSRAPTFRTKGEFFEAIDGQVAALEWNDAKLVRLLRKNFGEEYGNLTSHRVLGLTQLQRLYDGLALALKEVEANTTANGAQ